MSQRNAELLKELEEEVKEREDALVEEVGAHELTDERERHHREVAAKLRANPGASTQQARVAKAAAETTLTLAAEGRLPSDVRTECVPPMLDADPVARAANRPSSISRMLEQWSNNYIGVVWLLMALAAALVAVIMVHVTREPDAISRH